MILLLLLLLLLLLSVNPMMMPCQPRGDEGIFFSPFCDSGWEVGCEGREGDGFALGQHEIEM